MATAKSSKTFALKTDLEKSEMHERSYIDFVTYLYSCKPVKQNQGSVLVHTDPAENGGHVISPGFSNGFVGALYRAYNEHRHLILRPDDVWLAITSAFGLFMGDKQNAEMLRKQFVDFEGKMELEVKSAGTLYTVNWASLIDRMSDLIEKNTRGDARTWLQSDFSTTTPVCRTVSQVVLMGVMKHYFGYKFSFRCGLPKVTLEGTLEDWQKLQEKARRFSTLGVESLSHWAGLLDFILQKMVDSYQGNVDVDFWSRLTSRESWGSGPRYIAGWVNVFMPFSEKGEYRLQDATPTNWGKVDQNDVPPSAVEVPVEIDDNGRKYDTIFYGGHLVCVYDPEQDTIRPSVDWAMVDITGSTGPTSKRRHGEEVPARVQNYKPETLPKPTKFSYGA